MRIVGVIDLAGGTAVHARGGRRDWYAPVQTACGQQIDGDSLALARAYAGMGVDALYVADLDAIGGKPMQRGALARLTQCGLPMWVDAGTTTAGAAAAVLDAGAARVIVGLETLPRWTPLATIVDTFGGRHCAFSLDLRGDAPVATGGLGDLDVPELVRGAAAAGVGSLIVIDLTRVGAASGPNLPLLRRIRETASGLPLFVGGGVRGDADVQALAAEGVQGVLVATALHQGRVHTRLRR